MTMHFLDLIESRVSTNAFDPSKVVPVEQIQELVRLATHAPTAYNLQNWRFIAVHTSQAKARLRAVASDQPKITDAAVTFIIAGALPDHADVAERLRPAVEAGFMPERMVAGWEEAVRQAYGQHPGRQRDEAFRTATFAGATLMFAAQAFGLASCPMGGFDADGVAREFSLGSREIPVMLLAVGQAAEGNWPAKPRRPVGDVLSLV
ncbi:putative NAD(P)H nitroreductase YodC [Ensifer sp. M14]|jgi:nitroreductase|uniref:nitroreductase family protein n=1 Tax=Ensifer sp. M14 TaxID=2203782 RepID=UPI000E1DCD8A|nr:nitroreductase family protein [Ensifer sp. M14]RDL49920.1 putative NAD(P)H nitroreductase YodC [Ensifer sp. M14]